MATKSPQDSLRAAVDRVEPRIKAQVERALKALQDAVPLSTLEQIIAAQDAYQLHALVGGLGRNLQTAARSLEQVFRAGADAGRLQVGRGVTLRTRFSATNPLATKAAREQAAELVTNVTAQTRDAIRTVVARAFEDGIPPREAARLIKPLVGLTERQAGAVAGRYRDLVAGGLSRTAAQAQAKAYAGRLRSQRALMIARTETIAASTKGQLAAWDEAVRNGQLSARARKVWITTADDRLCPRCAAMDGKTAPLDGKFSGGLTGVGGPPLHPNCRCAIGLQLEGPAEASAAAERRRREDAEFLAKPSSAFRPVNASRRDERDTFHRYRDDDGNWTPERARLHDAIVAKKLATARPVAKPVINVLGGGPASGKSTALQQMRLPKNALTVDVDDIRTMLPEYGEMTRAGDIHAARFTHEESSAVAKRLGAEAVKRRLNVVLDGVNDNGIDAIRAKVKTLRAQAGGRKLKATFVTVDTETAILRADARGRQTGRFVPHDYIRDTHASISEAFPTMIDEGLYDELTLWDTNGDKPVKVVHARGRKVRVIDRDAWERFLAKGRR